MAPLQQHPAGVCSVLTCARCPALHVTLAARVRRGAPAPTPSPSPPLSPATHRTTPPAPARTTHTPRHVPPAAPARNSTLTAPNGTNISCLSLLFSLTSPPMGPARFIPAAVCEQVFGRAAAGRRRCMRHVSGRMCACAAHARARQHAGTLRTHQTACRSAAGARAGQAAGHARPQSHMRTWRRRPNPGAARQAAAPCAHRRRTRAAPGPGQLHRRRVRCLRFSACAQPARSAHVAASAVCRPLPSAETPPARPRNAPAPLLKTWRTGLRALRRLRGGARAAAAAHSILSKVGLAIQQRHARAGASPAYLAAL